MPRKFKRAIIVISSLIIAFCLIVPKVIGTAVRETLTDQALNQLAIATGGQINISRSKLESRWFNSSAEFIIDLTHPQNNNAILSLPLLSKIHHGPILLTQTGLDFGLLGVEIILDLAKLSSDEVAIELGVLAASVVAGFNQNLTVEASIPNLEIRSKRENLYISMSELNFDSKVNLDLSGHTKLTLNEILIQNRLSNIQISLNNPSLTLETEGPVESSSESALSVVIPSLAASEPLSFKVNNLRLDWRSTPSSTESGLTNFSQHILMDEIVSELPLTSFSWKSEMSGVSDELIASYNRMLLGMQSQTVMDPLSRVAELTRYGNETSSLLIQNELKLANVLIMESYEGKHSLELDIAWEGLPGLSRIEDLNFEDALEALAVEGNLSLSQEALLASPFAALAEHYTNENYLIPNNGVLSLQAVLDKGLLTVNDEAIPLGQFVQ